MISCLSLPLRVELNHCLYLLFPLHGQQKPAQTVLRTDFIYFPQHLLIYTIQNVCLKGSVAILKGLKIEIQFSLDDLVLKDPFLDEPLCSFLRLKLQKEAIIGFIEPPNRIDDLGGREILGQHLHIHRLL